MIKPSSLSHRIPVSFSESLISQKEATRPSDQVSTEVSLRMKSSLQPLQKSGSQCLSFYLLMSIKPLFQALSVTAGAEKKEVEKQPSVEEEAVKKEALER